MSRLGRLSSVFLALPILTAAAAAQVPLYVFDGEGPGDHFGSSVASAGDVDGDGRADLLVGAYSSDEGGINGGKATVFSGATGAVLLEVTGGVGAWLGWSVAGAGDVDGDGTPDFVVGLPNVERARIFSGADGSELRTLDGAGGNFGEAVAGTGDVNGDGSTDVIVGAPYFGNGNAILYSGLDGTVLQLFTGEQSFERFGNSVAGVGDIDQDGRGDVAIGGPLFGKNTSTGIVRVHSGATGAELWRWRGPIDSWAGHSVAAAGDVDGDGVPDVIAGAPETLQFGVGAGRAFVLSGATGKAVRTFVGDSPGDGFGHAVAGLGDTDGDGVPDLAVGAWHDDDNGTDSGSVRVFSGASGAVLATYYGEAADDRFGRSVAAAGRVNADGSGELIVGAFRSDAVANNAGRAYVFAGACFGALGNYCAAGVSASGCRATMAAGGTASATAASGFVLSAAGVEGAKNGAFFYGTGGRQAAPWGNGTSLRCIVPPLQRLALRTGAGTAGACDGSFALDLNALWCPTCPRPGLNPGAGTATQAQLWYRDPQSTSNQSTSFSDAIEFSICP